jgi:hypothetical protein
MKPFMMKTIQHGETIDRNAFKQIIENNDNQSAHLHHVPSHAVVLSKSSIA